MLRWGTLALAAAALWVAGCTRQLPPSHDPVAGNAGSAVRVIVYQDLQCPSCAQWHTAFMAHTIPAYSGQVGFEFRDYPLPQHPWAFDAAVLARYFDTRDAATGLAFRDFCFTHRNAIIPSNLVDQAAAFGQDHGVTRADLDGALKRDDLRRMVEADQARADQDHVEHTPTVFLGGVEAQSPDELAAMIDQALAAKHR